MFEFIEPQGGVKQSKEEAMHMLYSLKTSADDHAWKSPNLGTCNMNTDANGRRQGGTPTIPYEGYEDVDTTAAAVPTDNSTELVRHFRGEFRRCHNCNDRLR
jgi:hypothetical protein